MNVNPLYLMYPSVLATSYTFLFPVATPPNAVAFGFGRITVLDMVCGVLSKVFFNVIHYLCTALFSVLRDTVRVKRLGYKVNDILSSFLLVYLCLKISDKWAKICHCRVKIRRQ